MHFLLIEMCGTQIIANCQIVQLYTSALNQEADNGRYCHQGLEPQVEN